MGYQENRKESAKVGSYEVCLGNYTEYNFARVTYIKE